MRRLLILFAALMMPYFAGAQAQINTKKVKIGDFTQKTTKVVLTGNAFYDGALQDEVAAKWRVSPYEFCTIEDFDILKGNDSYYFLLTTKGQFKKEKEAGMQFLTLVKGGKEAENGIDNMLEIVSMPFAPTEDPTGRELTFLPAFLDIIQNYALDSMETDINAYTGLANYTLNITKAGKKRIVFLESDVNKSVDKQMQELYFDAGITMEEEEEDADRNIMEHIPDVLVSYTVSPATPGKGSFCYKMLIDAGTHQLYYFRKHRISKKCGLGFLPEDIRRIAAPRTYGK